MTEKRLIVDEDYNIVDTETGKWLDDNQMFDLVNELHEENRELKSDNDIKFWKLQFMNEYNSAQFIMHELSLAIDAGYTISDDFQKYIDGLKEQNKKNIEKAERLGI